MGIIAEIIGLLLILTALALTSFWVTQDRQYKKYAVFMCLLAVFAGLLLMVYQRAIEITFSGIGTIRAAAEQATTDAKVIGDIRKRIEAQSASVYAVADKATRVEALTREQSKKIVATETKLEDVDKSLIAARGKVTEIGLISEFTRTALAAQNDDRSAFDRLETWANDKKYPFHSEAMGAWMSVLDAHAQPFYASGFTVPWKEDLNPSSLTLNDLRKEYRFAPLFLRPALIEYVWNRQDFSKQDRIGFLAEVLRSDESLKAAEYAGRFLNDALETKLKPLAVKDLLEAWEKQRFSIK